MRAIQVTRFGGPEVLRMTELPIPVPGPGEILVHVKAAGLNFADVFARLGIYPNIPKPPFVPGIEYSGVIEQLGTGVRGLKKGDRVFGFSRQGAYAEYVVGPRDFVKRMPRTMTFEEAASFTVMFLTASHGLEALAHASPGETVLIHAGAGGVGIACIQIAKHLGLRVIATVGSEEKVGIAKAQGADEVINYSVEDFTKAVRRITGSNGVDIIMDGVGAWAYRKGIKLLAPMGRYVLFGVSAINAKRFLNFGRIAVEYMRTPRIVLSSMIHRNIGLFAFNLYLLDSKVPVLSRALDRLITLYTKGILKPVIGSKYPLQNAAKAHWDLQSRKLVGRSILLV